MIKALFMSADKDLPHCSFHELGLWFHNFLSFSKVMDVTFFDAGTSQPYPPFDINDFDVAFFNYHFQVWRNYPKSFFDTITIPKVLVNYETRYYPWASPSHLGDIEDLFTHQVIPDTNIDDLEDDRVLLLPRIVARGDFPQRPVNLDHPIVSTYGLPHSDKDVIGSFTAVQKEFDTATFRMHFAPDSRHTNDIMKQMHAYCQSIKKPGITLEFSDDFKSTEGIPRWLYESDLNIFFYHDQRDEVTHGTFPGSIDAAITARRPIAVQDMLCTRYITSYIRPYPKQSLREIMGDMTGVQKMYEDGDPSKAILELDKWVTERFGG